MLQIAASSSNLVPPTACCKVDSRTCSLTQRKINIRASLYLLAALLTSPKTYSPSAVPSRFSCLTLNETKEPANVSICPEAFPVSVRGQSRGSLGLIINFTTTLIPTRGSTTGRVELNLTESGLSRLALRDREFQHTYTRFGKPRLFACLHCTN